MTTTISYAIVNNPFHSGDELQGYVRSWHDTAREATAALDRAQDDHRRANPGTRLHIAVVEVTWSNDTHARGRGVTER